MSLCDEVREGEMKQLDSSVLHAMDLDVPKNILSFSVVKAPQHGSIINHSGEKPVHKRREAGLPSSVVDFTMTDLTNGTTCNSMSVWSQITLSIRECKQKDSQMCFRICI